MKGKRLFGIIVASLAFVCAAVGESQDQAEISGIYKVSRYEMLGKLNIPQQINYQGYLTDVWGNPITDTLNMSFSVWTDSTYGDTLWSEIQPSVAVINGLFNVLLGSVNPISPFIFANISRWLQTQVGTEVLTPRKEIVSVGYSFKAFKTAVAEVADYAHNADKLDGEHADAFADSAHHHDERYYTQESLKISDGDAPNAGSNIVHWNNLWGVPAGFADGTDDVGTGGGISQINAGTGINVINPTGPTTTVAADIGTGANQVAAGDHDHDADYVNEGQSNSVTTGMVVDAAVTTAKIANNAVTTGKIADGTITTADIDPDVVSSLDGVSNDGGNIDLIEGTDITITPNDVANTITISCAGGGGGISQINAGTGISVTNPTGPTTTVGLESSYADGSAYDAQFVNEGQSNSITSSMITNGEIVNADISGTATINPSKISGTAWTSANDGTGSGLDADLLDGQHASDFLSTTNDYGRSGVATDLYEGTTALSDKYVNETGPETMAGSSSSPILTVTNSGSGPGAYGSATGSSGAGVHGEAFGSSGSGVYGVARTSATSGYGVYGKALGSSGYAGYFLSNNYRGLYAKGGGGNEAAYLDGDVDVTGTLSKGAGSFKIDHPLDPENKYLYHSFVESPDMLNIYNGNTILNNNGEAWVELSEWFEALNKDFHYQITAIGGPGPNLYIAEEISDNRFKIARGDPGMKVSWQITGIRQDPYANAHRIHVEEEKPTVEQGYYLHPDVYGQPEEKSIEWACDPEGMRRMKENKK